MSAQGPACGYKVWMNRIYDAGQIVSANEYLTGEIKRVLGVLDGHLVQRVARTFSDQISPTRIWPLFRIT